MARPHVAAIVEDAVYRRLETVLRGRGWATRVVGHAGYGNAEFVRVLGRVVLTRAQETGTEAVADARATWAELEEAQSAQRGWRAFLTAPAMEAPVTVTVGDRTVPTRTDRGGYLDLVVGGHGLGPGWHKSRIETTDGRPVHADVHLIDPEVSLGVVSDIDDTVMITHLPRMFIAAWNTFVRSEQARDVVPGMASLYRSLLTEQDGAPIFYLSTGAWNTAPTLMRFLKRHGYPPGPLLLTDWGPTNTGWFRSGQEHKRAALHRLAGEFPHIRWVLVGDDGQHDPAIYGDFARDRPDVVEAIGIRQLTATEQVLSHGFPVSNEELLGQVHTSAPTCRAPDGYTLHRLIQNTRSRATRLRA